MNRTKLAGTVAAIAALAFLAGCSSTPSAPASSTASGKSAADMVPASIRQTGQLRIGNSPVYPPMSFLPAGATDDSAREGFDVDLGKALAKKLHLTPIFQRQQYEQFLPSLSTNRLDIVLSAMQDIPDRRTTATFVDYYYTGSEFFTTDADKDITSAKDLCGKTVSIGVANTGDHDAVQAFSTKTCGSDPITITSATDNAAALVALKQNRAAANVRGAESVSYLLNTLEPHTYKTVGKPLNKIPAGIAVAKSNTQLVAAITEAMAELMQDGTYQKIGEKWHLSDLLLTSPLVNGAKP